MNAHLPQFQQPQPFPLNLAHIPPDALAHFLAQFPPQTTLQPPPSATTVQPDIEQAAELKSLRDKQAQQEVLNQKLAKEIEDLKDTMRRTNENASGSGPDPGSAGERSGSKKRKNTKKKSKFLLNVPLDTLDDHQGETRAELMKLVGAEMKRLTGEGDDVCGSSDEEDDSEEPERKTMKLDFDANVDSVFNKKVVDRVSGLVFDEQTKKETCTFEHKNVKFTLADVRAFAKDKFRTMKRGNIEHTKSGPRQKRASQNRKNKLRMRQRYLKGERTKAVPDYIINHQLDPSPLLENTDCMTEEMSKLDTDTDTKKIAHRRKIIEAAGLNAKDIEARVTVWEIVRPGHCSDEAAKIYDELDALRRVQCKVAKTRNAATRLVDLGRRSTDAPISSIYPFMLNTGWYQAFTEENPTVTVEVQESNPEGFGEIEPETPV